MLLPCRFLDQFRHPERSGPHTLQAQDGNQPQEADLSPAVLWGKARCEAAVGVEEGMAAGGGETSVRARM